ncbi:MAG: hypothetical protein KKC51_05880, partial [Verrucomicrobia bacterium]|nr:hypothetical protein [Verrucomicrobiota bacterium]
RGRAPIVKAPRILVSRPATPFSVRPRPAAASELGRAFSAFLILGTLTALAYAGIWLHARWRAGPPEADMPHAEPAALPQPQIPEESRKISFREPEETVPAPTRPSAAEEVITWDHPAFVRGARQFNEAVVNYQRYIQDRTNPELLKEIERQCREAITAFESCRNEAPPEVRMADILTQAYRLLSDCRQMMLLPDASSAAGSSASP